MISIEARQFKPDQRREATRGDVIKQRGRGARASTRWGEKGGVGYSVLATWSFEDPSTPSLP